MNPSAFFSLLILLPALSLAAVAAFVPSSPAANNEQVSGNASRGQAIFDGKGNCLSCHRVADQGSYMGPDLSSIGDTLKPEELHKTLVSPDATVSPQNRLYRVITNDGKAITGRLLNQDIHIVQMLTSDAHLVALKKSSLRSFDFIDTPPMPSYRDKLTTAEQTDLVAYLASLRGVIKQ